MSHDPTDSPRRLDEIALGRIAGTHGLRGEVRVRLYNLDSAALHRGMAVRLRRRDGGESEHVIQTLRPHKTFQLVTFEGFDSIDAAEALIGAELSVPVDSLPALGPDEIYHFQLVGLDVRTVDGRDIGRIVEIIDMPAHAVCVVRDGARETLVPYVAEIIHDVDVDANVLVIDPPPGLIEAEPHDAEMNEAESITAELNKAELNKE